MAGHITRHQYRFLCDLADVYAKATGTEVPDLAEVADEAAMSGDLDEPEFWQVAADQGVRLVDYLTPDSVHDAFGDFPGDVVDEVLDDHGIDPYVLTQDWADEYEGYASAEPSDLDAVLEDRHGTSMGELADEMRDRIGASRR